MSLKTPAQRTPKQVTYRKTGHFSLSSWALGVPKARERTDKRDVPQGCKGLASLQRPTEICNPRNCHECPYYMEASACCMGQIAVKIFKVIYITEGCDQKLAVRLSKEERCGKNDFWRSQQPKSRNPNQSNIKRSGHEKISQQRKRTHHPRSLRDEIGRDNKKTWGTHSNRNRSNAIPKKVATAKAITATNMAWTTYHSSRGDRLGQASSSVQSRKVRHFTKQLLHHQARHLIQKNSRTTSKGCVTILTTAKRCSHEEGQGQNLDN